MHLATCCTVHHVPKCMRAHCFHDNIFIIMHAHLASMTFEHSLCHGSLMTPCILFAYYLHIYIYIYIYIKYNACR